MRSVRLLSRSPDEDASETDEWNVDCGCCALRSWFLDGTAELDDGVV